MTMREEFEARFKGTMAAYFLGADGGKYQDDYIEARWQDWQAAYAAGQRAERQCVLDVCAAEVRMFQEQAARNDGLLSDMAAGSIDTAQRVLGAIRNRKEQG